MDDTSSLTTRVMVKTHIHGVGRRHLPHSAQTAILPIIADQHLHFHMHPSLAITIHPSQWDTRRGARGTRTTHHDTTPQLLRNLQMASVGNDDDAAEDGGDDDG